MRADVRGERPYRRAIWINGHWAWTGTDYVWVSGRWTYARVGYRYVQPRYVLRDDYWVYRPGVWVRVDVR